MAEEESDAPVAVRRRRRIVKRGPTLAESGFLLSLTLALVSAGTALRGASIVVQPPEQVLLFRDGDGDRAVLTFAVRAAMINAAADQGDVVMKATIQPLANGPWFASDAVVQPVFTSDEKAVEKCELGARCIGLPGLLAIERADEIVDIPGGAVKARYFSFPAAQWNCDGDDAACARFARFDTAVSAMAKPLSVKVRLKLNDDGQRELTCSGRAVDAAYLRRVGWVGVSCKSAKVTGASLF